MACDCDSLFPLPVEEKVIMGTWRALAIPFPQCLSRKRQSWEHGVRLRIPFPSACRGKGSRGVPTIRFSLASRGKGFPRDSAGLRGWGAHGAPQGADWVREAPWGFVAWNCRSFHRQGEMTITGTLGWGIVHDGLFIDRQREKGWRPPRPKPPLALGF